ncbi:MAG: DUF4296 domain-containing protein [Christiangramia sp.]|uniref:DUF4296 domain-containing protein n=1 Tax=Christiangramia sp. TaxID=1931228 RepID=UPI003242D5E7
MTGKFRNSVFWILIGLAAFSCQDVHKAEKPDDLIAEDQMIDILTELSLIQAARNFNKQKLEDLGINPDEYIYEKYGIDSLQFEKSSDYYAENYLEYDRMYDSVKARIEKLKVRLDSIRDREIEIRDSLALITKDSLKMVDSLRNTVKMDSLEIEQFMKNWKGENVLLEEQDAEEQDSLIAPPAIIKTDNSN